MKYFTPKLYSDLNSRDVDVADVADSRWDQAEQEYEARLKEIRALLSDAAKTLADGICLHDVELIQQWNDDSQLVLWVGSALSGYVLRYQLLEPPKLGVPRKSPPFSAQSVRWLYDEIDTPRKGVYSHEILFSDGRELRVVFDDCLIVETRPLKIRRRRRGKSALAASSRA